ncbi:MAG: hypothetical protein PHD48_07325 [Alphaproteobacteria bacterium]|nr:hypothetical protein [Alphaproteobacteria bacterium]
MSGNLHKKRKQQKGRSVAVPHSERDTIVLAAYELYSGAQKRMGLSAMDAFHNFVMRLDNKQPKGKKLLTVQEAREIISSPVKFAETLVDADRAFLAEQQEKFRVLENKDIADIKKSVAIKVTLWVAGTFCILSPVVSEIEKPAIDWAKNEIATEYKLAKEAYENWQKSKVAPVRPYTQDKSPPVISAPQDKKFTP